MMDHEMTPAEIQHELALRNLRPWARNRPVVLLMLPVTVIAHAVVGAWGGMVEGVQQFQEAWQVLNAPKPGANSSRR